MKIKEMIKILEQFENKDADLTQEDINYLKSKGFYE